MNKIIQEATQCEKENKTVLPKVSKAEPKKIYYNYKITEVPQNLSMWKSVDRKKHQLNNFERICFSMALEL